MSIVDNRPMESSEIPEGSNPSLRTEKKSVGLEVLRATQKDFTSYVAAAAYGMWESMQAMKPYIAPGVGMVSQELTHPRAQEGIRKLFEQNVGDGTIVALGFLGGEAVLQTINIIGKELGKKGINPEIRFLASLTFGVATAIYLETTTIMNNTVDIPGDLFGVALGVAAILTGKVAQKHLTEENLTKLMVAGSELSRTIPEKLKAFSHKLSESLKKERPEELNPENLATEFVSIIEEKET